MNVNNRGAGFTISTADLDSVAAHARHAPDRIAVVECESGFEVSYRLLHEMVEAAALWIEGELQPGDRLAWLARNNVEMLVAHLACSRSGRIFVPLNWRLSAPELTAIIADCEPALLITSEEFAATAQSAAETAAVDCRIEAGLGRRDGDGGARLLDPEQPCVLIYTSGTTGRPKGVIHTERTIHYSSMNIVLGADRGPESRALCDAPLFHVIGLLIICRASLLGGGTILMSAGFDPAKSLARLQEATHYCGVPQMLDQLRQRPEFAEFDGSRLVSISVGGAPSTTELISAWRERGLPVLIGFGMSEIGALMQMPPAAPEWQRLYPMSCGPKPFFGSLRICDDAGNEVPVGTAGEIWVNGPTVTPGYWRRPEETRELFRDGWMRTGDIGSVNADGFHFILDRKKDMFISGGENVYPAEIESVIAGIAGVREVAVVGVPDARWGEVACAFVNGDVEAEAVVSVCAHALAKYKVPTHVVLNSEIPRNGSGKPLKQLLRARFLE